MITFSDPDREPGAWAFLTGTLLLGVIIGAVKGVELLRAWWSAR